MTVSNYFSSSYREARYRFLAAAASVGARIRTHINPVGRGAEAEELATDVAVLGADMPTSMLVLISGTHGVEGFCGSACQTGFMHDRLHECLAKKAAVAIIHALNPFGFSWQRRCNEDNVDLNWNFLDFQQAVPSAHAYEKLHSVLVPATWNGEARALADLELKKFIEQQGVKALQDIVQPGQYSCPDGLFYGGTRPVWSNRTFWTILKDCVPSEVRSLCVIDLHTGLGPSGYGEVILSEGAESQLDRARDWFGSDVKNATSSVSSVVSGSLLQAVATTAPPNRSVMPIVIEFGTLPLLTVLEALRSDASLHRSSPIIDEDKASVGVQMRAAFLTDTPAWKSAAYGRFSDLAYRAAMRLD